LTVLLIQSLIGQTGEPHRNHQSFLFREHHPALHVPGQPFISCHSGAGFRGYSGGRGHPVSRIVGAGAPRSLDWDSLRKDYLIRGQSYKPRNSSIVGDFHERIQVREKDQWACFAGFFQLHDGFPAACSFAEQKEKNACRASGNPPHEVQHAFPQHLRHRASLSCLGICRPARIVTVITTISGVCGLTVGYRRG